MRKGFHAMAHWQRQPRGILGLAAALLSFLLVQSAFGLMHS
jgi:hypothetical protein